MEALLRRLNPAAELRRTTFCQLDLRDLLHTNRSGVERVLWLACTTE